MWIRVVSSQSAHNDGAHARDEAYEPALDPAISRVERVLKQPHISPTPSCSLATKAVTSDGE